MPRSRTKEEAYAQCEGQGMFIPQQDIDKGKISSMLSIVQDDLDAINDLKQKGRWNTIYKLSYDVLHTLTEAFLLFDQVKSMNHQCLFAYLCMKYPELEFEWDFFEAIRTKRNGIHYYGARVGSEDWKWMQVGFSVYVSTLKEKILTGLQQS